MNVKKYFKLAPIVFLCSASVFATELTLTLRPYLGFDAQWRHMGFHRGFGDNLFRKNLPQLNGYIGVEANDFLGLEAGFESTALKSTKNVILNPGDNGPGFIIDPPPDPSESHRFKTSLRGWHVNFIGFTPWFLQDNSLRFFGGVGFSHKRLHATDDGILLQNNKSYFTRTFTDRKSLLRISAGAQKNITKRFGLKASAIWENTNKFRLVGAKENPTGITKVSLKNSITLGLGVFFKF